MAQIDTPIRYVRKSAPTQSTFKEAKSIDCAPAWRLKVENTPGLKEPIGVGQQTLRVMHVSENAPHRDNLELITPRVIGQFLSLKKNALPLVTHPPSCCRDLISADPKTVGPGLSKKFSGPRTDIKYHAPVRPADEKLLESPEADLVLRKVV